MPALLDRKVRLLGPDPRRARAAAPGRRDHEVAREIEWAKARLIRPEGYAAAAAAGRREPPSRRPRDRRALRALRAREAPRGAWSTSTTSVVVRRRARDRRGVRRAPSAGGSGTCSSTSSRTSNARPVPAPPGLARRPAPTCASSATPTRRSTGSPAPTRAPHHVRAALPRRGGRAARRELPLDPAIVRVAACRAARATTPRRSRAVRARRRPARRSPRTPPTPPRRAASPTRCARPTSLAARGRHGRALPHQRAVGAVRGGASAAGDPLPVRGAGRVPRPARGEGRARRAAARDGRATGAGRSRPTSPSSGATRRRASEERREHVDALVRLGHEYLAAEGGAGSVAGFLAYLEASLRGGDDGSARTGDAVELLTSTGPRASSGTRCSSPASSAGWCPISHAETPAALDEERRLLYVALTRAERHAAPELGPEARDRHAHVLPRSEPLAGRGRTRARRTHRRRARRRRRAARRARERARHGHEGTARPARGRRAPPRARSRPLRGTRGVAAQPGPRGPECPPT